MNSEQARALFQQAAQEYSAKNFESAIEKLDRFVQAFPEHPDAQYARAKCLAQLGRVEDARLVCNHLSTTLGDARGEKLIARLAGAQSAPAPVEATLLAAPEVRFKRLRKVSHVVVGVIAAIFLRPKKGAEGTEAAQKSQATGRHAVSGNEGHPWNTKADQGLDVRKETSTSSSLPRGYATPRATRGSGCLIVFLSFFRWANMSHLFSGARLAGLALGLAIIVLIGLPLWRGISDVTENPPPDLSAMAGTQITLNALDDGPWNAALSPDGTRLAIGTRNPEVTVYDTTTGQEVFRLSGHSEFPNRIAYSPDGTRLATASNDGTARVWDASTGAEILALPHDYPVELIAFSEDSRFIISSPTLDSKVHAIYWDGNTGAKLVEFSPNGGLWRGSFEWISIDERLPNGKVRPRMRDGITLGPVRQEDNVETSYGPVSISELESLRTRNIGDWTMPLMAAVSPDRKRVATYSATMTARHYPFFGRGRDLGTVEVQVWDVATREPVFRLDGHQAHLEALTYTSSGRYIATVDIDSGMRIYDADTGALVTTKGPPADFGGVGAIAVSPCRSLITIISQKGWKVFWASTEP